MKTKIYIRDFATGPGLGLDWNTASFGHLAVVVGFSFNSMSKWKVMRMPTNEAWINPWVNYLKSKGVKFNYGYSLKYLDINDNSYIDEIILEKGNDLLNVKANEYIIAIDPFSYRTVLNNTLKEAGKYKKYLKQQINILQ